MPDYTDLSPSTEPADTSEPEAAQQANVNMGSILLESVSGLEPVTLVERYDQRIYDATLQRYVYYSTEQPNATPTPDITRPNHSGNLVASTHEVLVYTPKRGTFATSAELDALQTAVDEQINLIASKADQTTVTNLSTQVVNNTQALTQKPDAATVTNEINTAIASVSVNVALDYDWTGQHTHTKEPLFVAPVASRHIVNLAGGIRCAHAIYHLGQSLELVSYTTFDPLPFVDFPLVLGKGSTITRVRAHVFQRPEIHAGQGAKVELVRMSGTVDDGPLFQSPIVATASADPAITLAWQVIDTGPLSLAVDASQGCYYLRWSSSNWWSEDPGPHEALGVLEVAYSTRHFV